MLVINQKWSVFTAESEGRAVGTAPNSSKKFYMGTKRTASEDIRLEELTGRFSSGSDLEKLNYWGKE